MSRSFAPPAGAIAPCQQRGGVWSSNSTPAGGAAPWRPRQPRASTLQPMQKTTCVLQESTYTRDSTPKGLPGSRERMKREGIYGFLVVSNGLPPNEASNGGSCSEPGCCTD